jgi:branched-chain amino acid transport system permease protein
VSAVAASRRGAWGDRARRALPTLGPPLAILALQLVLFPLPAGVFVRGVIVGGVTALIALGMALIYRANRIVNFAQGDLGAAPAVLVFLLLSEWGWPYPLAVAVGAAAAFSLGGLVELTVIRRFFRAPRLVLTVATIGLAQVLTGIAVLLPLWWGTRLLSPRIADPFELRLVIGDTIFRANSMIALVVAPLAMLALALFLRATRVGIAIRASADRSDRAALLGIPVKRLQTLVWAVAGLLAFTATFMRAGILGLPVGSVLSLGLLLRSLTALLLGGLVNLPAIGACAVALGVLELGVDWHGGRDLPLLGVQAPPLDAILAVVVLAALLLRRRSAGRADLDDQSSWQAADEVRPVPAELARLPEVRWARRALLGAAGVVALVLPHLLGVDHSLKASAVLIYAILGLSIVVLTGWAGQVSLGQVAFFALGAATAAWMARTWQLDMTLAVLAAGALGAAAAVVVGLPALRFKGLYLAVTTFAFALATTSYLLNRRFFEWVPSQRITRQPLLGQVDLDSATNIYYVMLGALVLTVLALRGVRRSRTGRVLVAMRDNERSASAYGISAVRAKLTAFALSGFIAAAAGALFVHHQGAFGEIPYQPGQNLAVFAMVVVGGVTSLGGAVLGALWLQGTGWFLPLDWQFLASGVGVLLVLLVLPGGLGGLVSSLRDHGLRWVATRRGIVVPSILADSRVVDEEEPAPTPLPGVEPEPVAAGRAGP